MSKYLLFTPFFDTRTRIGFSSTAAERRTTGDDCHNDDGDDDQSLSVTHVRMLEVKANKLEEQVQDLTVSHVHLLQVITKASFIQTNFELIKLPLKSLM